MQKATRPVARLDAHSFFFGLYRDLHSFVACRTGAPPSDVEDIVQETLCHAWRDRAGLRDPASLKEWVRAIARNRVIEYRRRQVRRTADADLVRRLSRIDRDVLPPSLLESDEVRSRIRSALRKLPEPYSSLLVERYYEDRSVAEIARERGMSEDAAESVLRRARDAFRITLQDEESAEWTI